MKAIGSNKDSFSSSERSESDSFGASESSCSENQTCFKQFVVYTSSDASSQRARVEGEQVTVTKL